jgi:Cu/Ag efflux protein CusF
MRHISIPSAVLALGAAFACIAPVAATAAPGDVKAAGAQMSGTGTVTAIDPATRQVTVKNAQGVERSWQVDRQVQNLENVKVGDRVRVDYTTAVAVALRKGGDGIREKVEADAEMKQQPVEGKPGVSVGKRTTYVTNVISVDRKKQMVRLKGPQGRVADIKVQDKAALADVKPGDQVVAVVYESVAVAVKPAAPASSASAAR